MKDALSDIDNYAPKEAPSEWERITYDTSPAESKPPSVVAVADKDKNYLMVPSSSEDKKIFRDVTEKVDPSQAPGILKAYALISRAKKNKDIDYFGENLPPSLVKSMASSLRKIG